MRGVAWRHDSSAYWREPRQKSISLRQILAPQLNSLFRFKYEFYMRRVVYESGAFGESKQIFNNRIAARQEVFKATIEAEFEGDAPKNLAVSRLM